ncbi:DUF7529 family protein (plasmid) [Haloferacaceae archaeon DSL9]
MTEIGPDDEIVETTVDPDGGERAKRDGTAAGDAWARTVDEMRLLADQRREEGWEVVAVVAGNTAPTNPSAGPDDRLGLVFVVPGSDADPFTDAFERGAFSEYEVYRNTVHGGVFLVVEYRDPEARLAIMLAGQYLLERASGMVTAAVREGRIETYVQTLDGTVLGSFGHETHGKFVPETHAVVDALGDRSESGPDGE